MKITREQRWYFSYPDPISADVERHYLAAGRRVPTGFTEYLSRTERLQKHIQKGRSASHD